MLSFSLVPEHGVGTRKLPVAIFSGKNQATYWNINWKSIRNTKCYSALLEDDVKMYFSPFDVKYTSISSATESQIALSVGEPNTWCSHSHSVYIDLKSLDNSRCQWPHDLRRGLWPFACWDCGFESCRGHGWSVTCECCVLSRRDICVGLITSPEESYRVWCVWVWSWSLDNVEALAH
jgi:hypothetical protein